MTQRHLPRRQVLLMGGAAAVAAGPLAVGSSRAQQSVRLSPTPRQSEGPFYPPKLPADSDADLVRVSGAVREAGGEVMYLLGRVRSRDGGFLTQTRVEIWQCDVNGRYLHPRSGGFGPRDTAFQGFGRTLTDGSGAFQFRTIKPVPYPGRTPHIHVKVYPDNGRVLATQLYLRGHPLNQRDGIFKSLSLEEQDSLLMTVEPGTVDGETALQAVASLVVA